MKSTSVNVTSVPFDANVAQNDVDKADPNSTPTSAPSVTVGSDADTRVSSSLGSPVGRATKRNGMAFDGIADFEAESESMSEVEPRTLP